jgi:hypothetical protein
MLDTTRPDSSLVISLDETMRQCLEWNRTKNWRLIRDRKETIHHLYCTHKDCYSGLLQKQQKRKHRHLLHMTVRRQVNLSSPKHGDKCSHSHLWSKHKEFLENWLRELKKRERERIVLMTSISSCCHESCWRVSASSRVTAKGTCRIFRQRTKHKERSWQKVTDLTAGEENGEEASDKNRKSRDRTFVEKRLCRVFLDSHEGNVSLLTKRWLPHEGCRLLDSRIRVGDARTG